MERLEVYYKCILTEMIRSKTSYDDYLEAAL